MTADKNHEFGVGDFIRQLLRQHPYRLGVVVAAMMAVSLTQGMGLALLVPLLSLIGLSGADVGQSGRLTDWIAGGLQSIGLPVALETVLVCFLVAVTAENQLRYLQRRYTRIFLGNFVTNLRISLYEAYINAAWPFWHTKHLGHMANLLSMESYRVMVAFYELTVFLAETILVAVLLVVAFALSPQLSLLFLLGGGIVSLVVNMLLRNAKHAGTEVTSQNSILQEAIQEHLHAAKLIKASGMERESLQVFENIARKLNDTETKGNIGPYRLAAFLNPIVAGLLCLGLYLALTQLRINAAAALVVLFIFYRISTRAVMIQQAWHGLLLNAPAYGAISGELDEARRFLEQKPLPTHTLCPHLSRSIEVENVTYSYCPGLPVIQNVSLSIPVGKTVALVGGSGSGKSTLLDLILGLLRPEHGSIEIDGIDLREIDLRAWRSRIGYVGQDTILFHDSIINNIRWANPKATDLEVKDAAELAHADTFMKTASQGYETKIGHRGVRLSGGERQRLALARALVRRPNLLILDEATSNLDAVSEKAVQEAIDGLQRRITIIIVAHRLATVRNADWIYVLDKGHVVQEGVWTELTRTDGQFSTLWALQNGSLQESGVSEKT